MKRIVLDTNFLIPFLKDPRSPAKLISGYDEVLLPAIVIGEFRAGLFNTKAGRQNRLALEQFLQKSSVSIVPVTEATAGMYAKVFQALRDGGHPIPQNDMWIAASAIEHGADIATADEHFSFVPMLTVVLL